MNEITLIPAVRVSDCVQPELRLWSDSADGAELRIIQHGQVYRCEYVELTPGNTYIQDLKIDGVFGPISLEFRFFCGNQLLEIQTWPYEVIVTGHRGTGLLDGCWISMYHWSEDEGRLFNRDLRKLKDEDFAQQIRDMSAIGIRGVVIQNLFASDAYVGHHTMTCEKYSGRAFYPSKLYPGRVSITAKDPVEAILSAADECGMHVLMGIGLFAWFDFSEESLRWHKQVAREVFERYGSHSSFYGWYVSEEIMGDLYFSYMPENSFRWKELPAFFREFRKYVHTLAPTKPIAFAPNNIRFEHYGHIWRKILPEIDILIPFAFARDPEHWNVEAIRQICDSCNTHMWVDMEIFDMPFENGLFPKQIDGLMREIDAYQTLEQCYGYQYTGLLNHPSSPYNLGGEAAKQLYRSYEKVYRKSEKGRKN